MSVDTTAKTMTVKSRVAYQDAITELKQFKAGDRVWSVWSGLMTRPTRYDSVTSRNRPATEDDAVVAVRPYGETSTTE